MNTLSQSDSDLLQHFVDKFDELSELDFVPELDAIAKQFSVGKTNEFDPLEKWRPVRKATDASALDRLYLSLPSRLPKLYEGLLLNFRWAEVDLDIFTLTANPLSSDLSGWLAEASRDKFLWGFLLRSGYLPFGKGPDMDYDRVCFETKTRKKRDECRIVKIDHEEVLCNERIKIIGEIAPSFRSLVEQTIAHKKRSEA